MHSKGEWKRVDAALRRQAPPTFLVAVDLVGAVVFAVIEVVAAEDGADAASVGALELILLTYGYGR